MEYHGGCHCGNLQVHVSLAGSADAASIRSCSCSFCRSHGTRTISDPTGMVDIRATDPSLLEHYRFGSRTADYLLCRRCGVYVGAICATEEGLRAVVNTLCLVDRDAFDRKAARPDYDNEAIADRLARRAANWMPAVVHPLPRQLQCREQEAWQSDEALRVQRADDARGAFRRRSCGMLVRLADPFDVIVRVVASRFARGMA